MEADEQMVASADCTNPEILYRPSRWSYVSPDPEKVIQQYLNSVEQGANNVRELYGNRMHTKTHGNLPTDKTLIISGVGGNTKCLEIRTTTVCMDPEPETDNVNQSERSCKAPDQSERRAGEICVASIHGGYWVEGSYERDGLFCAEPFVSRGATFASIGYGPAPEVSLPAMIEQVGRASDKLLRDHTQRDGGLYMIGHCAGAYLIVMLLFKRWAGFGVENHPLKRLKGMILISGLFDLVPILPTSNNDSLSLTKEEAISLSPLTLLSQHTLDEHIQENIQAFKDGGGKVLVICGEHESPAFLSQSQEFTQILSRLGIKTQNITVPDCDHFDIYTNLRLNGTELPPSSKILLEFMNFGL